MSWADPGGQGPVLEEEVWSCRKRKRATWSGCESSLHATILLRIIVEVVGTDHSHTCVRRAVLVWPIWQLSHSCRHGRPRCVFSLSQFAQALHVVRGLHPSCSKVHCSHMCAHLSLVGTEFTHGLRACSQFPPAPLVVTTPEVSETIVFYVRRVLFQIQTDVGIAELLPER